MILCPNYLNMNNASTSDYLSLPHRLPCLAQTAVGPCQAGTVPCHAMMGLVDLNAICTLHNYIKYTIRMYTNTTAP